MSRLSPISLASEPPHPVHPGGHISNYNPSHSSDLLPPTGYNPHPMPPIGHNTYSPHPGGPVHPGNLGTDHIPGPDMLPSNGYTVHGIPPSGHVSHNTLHSLPSSVHTQTLPSGGHTSHQPASAHINSHNTHSMLPSSGVYNAFQEVIYPSEPQTNSGLTKAGNLSGNESGLMAKQPHLGGKGPRLLDSDSSLVLPSVNMPMNNTKTSLQMKTPAQMKAFPPPLEMPSQHGMPSVDKNHTRMTSSGHSSHSQVLI